MSRESLGVSQEQPFNFGKPNGEGATFVIPYRDTEYNILLSSLDLDKIYQLWVAKELGQKTLFESQFGTLSVGLPNGELPLMVFPEQVEKDPEAGWDIMMDVHVATMSSVFEHRGILAVVGSKSEFGWTDNDWWKVTYETLPPLEEPQPGDPFYCHPMVETTPLESSL